jgi:hypothetical protein
MYLVLLNAAEEISNISPDLCFATKDGIATYTDCYTDVYVTITQPAGNIIMDGIAYDSLSQRFFYSIRPNGPLLVSCPQGTLNFDVYFPQDYVSQLTSNSNGTRSWATFNSYGNPVDNEIVVQRTLNRDRFYSTRLYLGVPSTPQTIHFHFELTKYAYISIIGGGFPYSYFQDRMNDQKEDICLGRRTLYSLPAPLIPMISENDLLSEFQEIDYSFIPGCIYYKSLYDYCYIPEIGFIINPLHSGCFCPQTEFFYYKNCLSYIKEEPIPNYDVYTPYLDTTYMILAIVSSVVIFWLSLAYFVYSCIC